MKLTYLLKKLLITVVDLTSKFLIFPQRAVKIQKLTYFISMEKLRGIISSKLRSELFSRNCISSETTIEFFCFSTLSIRNYFVKSIYSFTPCFFLKRKVDFTGFYTKKNNLQHINFTKNVVPNCSQSDYCIRL